MSVSVGPSAHLHEHSESKKSRALFAELRRWGEIEGQNFKVESHGREQNTSGTEALATEIVGSDPDVILVVGPGAVFFKKLTSDFAAKKAFIVPRPDFRKLSSSSQRRLAYWT